MSTDRGVPRRDIRDWALWFARVFAEVLWLVGLLTLATFTFVAAYLGSAQDNLASSVFAVMLAAAFGCMLFLSMCYRWG